jgi:signal transduction histidine kinase
VRDEGRGIPQEEQARIFEPFQRAAGAQTAPGYGLGLYVCWRIVEAHGGRIAVESGPEMGSVFHFVLPREG